MRSKRTPAAKALLRSKPGIPDVKAITSRELVGSLTSFCEHYLGDKAVVSGPADTMEGVIGIDISRLALALRNTVELLSESEPVKLLFYEWDDELDLVIEAKELENEKTAHAVIDAWRTAGFKLRSYGFYLRLHISFEDAKSLVLRAKPEWATEALLRKYYLEY